MATAEPTVHIPPVMHSCAAPTLRLPDTPAREFFGALFEVQMQFIGLVVPAHNQMSDQRLARGEGADGRVESLRHEEVHARTLRVAAWSSPLSDTWRCLPQFSAVAVTQSNRIVGERWLTNSMAREVRN